MAGKPDPLALDQCTRLVILNHGLSDLWRCLRGYSAIEQLLRMPDAPDTADADDVPLTAVYRRDLCELLSQLGQHVEEKLDLLIQLAAAAQKEELQ